MRIEGRHSFVKDRQAIWNALQDPQTLAATLPGVRRLEVVGPDQYSVAADVGIGSVKGLFDGTFEVAEKKELESCVLRGSARGASGAAQLQARVTLADSDGTGTLLTYTADATVTGPIAGVGQRLVAAASKRMAEQFFKAVDDYRPAAAAEPAGVFERPFTQRADKSFLVGVAVGFAAALIAVAIGRWSALR
jgi:carbon monoxide dehydrogenase subunit G